MKININGVGEVTVGDEFDKMSPDDQNSFVAHIVEQTGKGIKSGLPSVVAATPKEAAPKEAAPQESAPQQVARALLGGIPFSDRAMAGMQTLHDTLAGTGKDYAGNLEDVRAANTRFEQEHPVGSLVGGLAGGAMLPIGALGAAAKIPATLGARALMGAGAGATLGAVQGVSNAPDLTSPSGVAEHAIEGSAVGGLLGSAIPVAGAGIGKLVGMSRARMAPGVDNLSRAATSKLAESAKADTIPALQGEASRLGPEAMLADLGPAMLGRTQGASLASDDARTVINNALKARSAEASNRILKTTDEALGAAEPPRVLNEGIRKEKSFADQVQYGRALGSGEYAGGGFGPPPVDTSALISHINAALPNAEGDEKIALMNLRSALFKPNPDLPENMPKASDYVAKGASGKAQSLVDFLRGMGGVQDEGGDLVSMGLNRYPGLVTRNGVPLDKAREAAAEAGYLGSNTEDAMANTYIHDLIDAMASHPRYTAADEPIVAMRDAARAQRGGQSQKDFWAGMQQMAKDATPPATVPKTEAVNLHKIKGDLDALISGQGAFSLGPGRFTRKEASVMEARKILNDLLEEQVPNYLEANRQSQGFNKQLEAHDIGTKVLGTGPEAPWPQELARRLESMTPEELSALKGSTRGRIQEKLNRTVNDLTAGKSIVQGDNDFNRANLAQIFGQEPTNKLVGRIESEKKFAQTLSDVIGNSQSAQRLAALRDMKPGAIDLPSSPKAGVKEMAVNAVTGLLARLMPDQSKSAGEMARALTAQGPQRDKMLNDLYSWMAEQEILRRSGGATGSKAAIGLLGPVAGEISRRASR